MVGNPFPFFTRLSQRGVGRQPQGGSYRSQLELQAINERGWLLTKAAEPATSKPKTMVNARNFIIVQIESPGYWISISRSSAAEMRTSGGTNTAFLSRHCDCRKQWADVAIQSPPEEARAAVRRRGFPRSDWPRGHSAAVQTALHRNIGSSDA